MRYIENKLSFFRMSFAGMMFSLCLFCLADAAEQVQASANSSKAKIEVSVIRVQEKFIESEMELSGRVAAFRTAEVRPQINGIICKRMFTEGSDVVSGQTLYQIDKEIYQAALESARAGLAQAEAVEYAARLKAQRYQKLVDTKAVSVQEQIEIQAAWKQAQAQVLAAKAAVKTARINLNYTDIKAPISGRIGKSLVSEGALVTAQQPSALAAIQQLNPVYVDVSQSADELLRLRMQMLPNPSQNKKSMKTRVQVLLPGEISHEQMGELAFSDVTVDPATESVILRAIIPNPDQLLLPGMFVRARLISAREQKMVMVPQSCLIRNNKGQSHVMVVTDASVVESRLVQTGPVLGQEIVIVHGLHKGEQVVVAGLQKIRPGMTVHPVLAGTEPATSESSSQSSEK